MKRFLFALAALVSTTLATLPAGAEADDGGPDLAPSDYCNALEPTPACISAAVSGVSRTQLPEDVDARYPAYCNLPEASITISGGFLMQDARGHGYIACSYFADALTISGVLSGEPTFGEIEVKGVKIPISYADGSFGQWACANNALCGMSTQSARAYGVRTCFSLQNLATAADATNATPPKQYRNSGFRCAFF